MTCPYCGGDLHRYIGYINRAKKLGVPIYCSRVCSGLARRVERTDEEKKKIKADYDRKRRKTIDRTEQIKSYNESPKGRAMQKRNSKKFKQSHLEYCRNPQYREYKKEYDETYRAKKSYGEFWEASIVLKKIDELILPEKQEAKIQKGTYNKSQKRKRTWNLLQKT